MTCRPFAANRSATISVCTFRSPCAVMVAYVTMFSAKEGLLLVVCVVVGIGLGVDGQGWWSWQWSGRRCIVRVPLGRSGLFAL